MKKKTLLAPSLFLSGILLFSGCGSSATTSAVHQNKSADSWAVEASEPLDDSGFSYDGEADMMDDTATAETAGSSSDSPFLMLRPMLLRQPTTRAPGN